MIEGQRFVSVKYESHMFASSGSRRRGWFKRGLPRMLVERSAVVDPGPVPHAAALDIGIAEARVHARVRCVEPGFLKEPMPLVHGDASGHALVAVQKRVFMGLTTSRRRRSCAGCTSQSEAAARTFSSTQMPHSRLRSVCIQFVNAENALPTVLVGVVLSFIPDIF